MIRRLFLFSGEVRPLLYIIAAPLLLLVPHLSVVWASWLLKQPVDADALFWLLPMRKLAEMNGLTATVAATGFALTLMASWALASLSFQRAIWARRGFALAGVAIMPVFQLLACLVLACMPRSNEEVPADPVASSVSTATTSDIILGVLSGVAIIVVAVLISAITFGAYGWGLFVVTPFMVGMTTGFLINRRAALGAGQTIGYVIIASTLGGIALIMFALEGLACILLIAPLAAITATIGGAIGRMIALSVYGDNRTLHSLAFLPALFFMESAMPPDLHLRAHEEIIIAAPEERVWQLLISDRPIASHPGIVGLAGLAYPVGGKLTGEGVGAKRIGQFSTGQAIEEVTAWTPGRVLAFKVLEQPPAMEEMSPYRRVYAPHVHGYFDTYETRFELTPLSGGRTRLTVKADHRLRIDPVVYWEPIARWAIEQNVRRVLIDLKDAAEKA